MSVSGISGSSFFAGLNTSGVQNKFQQIQTDFKQLGQDLQSGNLSQAQSVFSSLQQLLPNQQNGAAGTPTTSQSGTSVSQAFNQLGQDLSSGNLSAAQSDFATLQQDVQQQQGTISGHRHHHAHPDNLSSSSSSSQQNNPASLFGALDQALQSGNLTAAQQTYSALQQDFVQFTGGSGAGAGSGSSTSSSTSLNVSA